MENCSYRELGERIMEADNILILPHVHMDGDALGSSSALCMSLRNLGKKAAVLCCEPTPRNLDFLEFDCVTRDVEGIAEYFGGDYLAVMVDCSSLSRIKWREEAFSAARWKACIDHHGTKENDTAFDFGRIEAASAATGEIIYMLIAEMGWEVDLDIANALYAAISTDTGNYQFSNTSVRSHEISARLHGVEGFDAKRVSALIYQRNSINALRLSALMIESIRLYDGGRIAVGRVTESMLEESGALLNEAEGFVQTLLGIDGVEVACLLKDVEGKHVRISLRAKTCTNVANVAAAIGGGGHVLAAGAIYHGSVDDAEAKVVPLIEREL